MHEEEIRKHLSTKKLLIGRDETLKNIRKGLVSKVYLASNAPLDLVKDLSRYARLSGFDIFETGIRNDELGAVCKKPFHIAVLGVLK